GLTQQWCLPSLGQEGRPNRRALILGLTPESARTNTENSASQRLSRALAEAELGTFRAAVCGPDGRGLPGPASTPGWARATVPPGGPKLLRKDWRPQQRPSEPEPGLAQIIVEFLAFRLGRLARLVLGPAIGLGIAELDG